MRKKYFKYLTILILITLSSIYFIQFFKLKHDNNNLKISSNNDESDDNKYEFLKRYPFLLDCKTDYNKWEISSGFSQDEDPRDFNYSNAAPKEYHDLRITRAVIVYFPIERIDYFQYELRWLYRSWTEMLKYEPAKWRTDLVIFTENNATYFNRSRFFFNELNCSFENLRNSSEDKPMCTLVNYVDFEKRNFSGDPILFRKPEELYGYLLKYVDVFKTNNEEMFETFKKILKAEIGKYRYINSILIAFEGYEYFKRAGYDFLVRSDMDVFLTPLFGTWLPRHCNDFNVGKGAYSSDFAERRLKRATQDFGLRYAHSRNLGSTWYSTPDQFRLVSYLTLFGMVFVAREEFTPVERQGKLGPRLWPFWHYGVLLLYGQSVGLNHLIATKQINVVKLHDYLDYPSGNLNSVHSVLNIHVYHGPDMFSKFAFKMGKYDNMTVNENEASTIKFYSLKMAIEGKRFSCKALHETLLAATSNKS